MARDDKVEMAMKALNHGRCYLANKPLSHDTIANQWQHIFLKKKILKEQRIRLLRIQILQLELRGQMVASQESCR